MSEEQLYDAAEREMDLYRNEIARITAERNEAREQLAGLRDRIDSLARGLDMSARTSHPSKKSEIERGCADALFGLLRIDGESIAQTRQRLGVPG